MATGMTGQRHSPVGMEYEPEDKDLESIVKYNLEAFQPVVVRDVDHIDLIINYKYFSREQKKDLRHIGRNNSNEKVIDKALEMIDDMHDQPNKYSMLIEALKDAEIIEMKDQEMSLSFVDDRFASCVPVNTEQKRSGISERINKELCTGESKMAEYQMNMDESSQEMEPYEKDREKTVKFYLDAFILEIRKLLSDSDVKKLILCYGKFDTDQKSRLAQYSENKTVLEVFDEILKLIRNMENEHLKYVALAQAFEKMGHEKVHLILTGEALPTNDIHRQLIFHCGVDICQMMVVDQILDVLVMADVVCEEDRQAIQSKLDTKGNWQAAFQLLICLPNKKVDWYRTFMTILLEHKHKDLANLINHELKKMREDGKDTTESMSFIQQPGVAPSTSSYGETNSVVEHVMTDHQDPEPMNDLDAPPPFPKRFDSFPETEYETASEMKDSNLKELNIKPEQYKLVSVEKNTDETKEKVIYSGQQVTDDCTQNGHCSGHRCTEEYTQGCLCKKEETMDGTFMGSNKRIVRVQCDQPCERTTCCSGFKGPDCNEQVTKRPFLTTDEIKRIKEQLKIDEGYRTEIYLDTEGLKTFCIGHLIKKTDEESGKPVGTKVSDDRITKLFLADVEIAIAGVLEVIPGAAGYPGEVKEILVNMMFNLGRSRLKKFKKFIAALNKGDWNEAAEQMVDSKWYVQVGNRAERLVARMRAVKS